MSDSSDADNEIIELIDKGNYQLAQSLISKKIKKFPQKTLYYALNNEILFKRGETEQAIQNNLKLVEKIPNDKLTLSTLFKFFEAVGMERESNLVYENSIKRYPINNESTILEWFEGSISKYNLKSFNKIFVNLHKSAKENRLYTFWLAFSYYLLIVNRNTLKISDKEVELYKSLGLKIIEELHPLVNSQELFVYVSLLKLSNRDDDVTTVLKGRSDLDLELKLIYLVSLESTRQWSTLKEYTSKLLFEEDFNDFDTWKLWINSNNKLKLSSEDLISKINSIKPTRNSTLSLIEIAKAYGDSLNQPIINYYNRYNHKICCFYDLKGYLTDTDTAEFFTLVNNSTSELLSSSPSSVDDLIRLINNQKFNYLLSPNLDVDSYNDKTWKIYDIYKDNESIRGSEFDNNPLSDLVLISIIIDLSQDSSIESIINRITLLQGLLEKDKYNHKLKLWLMKLYCNLNTNDATLKLYQSMNIKMTQHESLSHYLIGLNPSKDNLTELVDIFRFYLTSDREIQSSVFEGFDRGVFTKLESFISFGKRLSNSVSRNLIILNVIRFSVVLGNSNYINYFINLIKYQADTIIQGEIIDNRDIKSEWKFGLVDEKSKNFDTTLLNDPINGDQVNSSLIRLNILKYLIIFESKDTTIQKYLKLYNKLLSSFKPKLAFDGLLLKLNHNILKLFKLKGQLNENEYSSSLNFFLKNFKFDKIKTSLIPKSYLSWELSHNLTNLVELVQIINILLKVVKPSKEIQDIKDCTEHMISDLKKFKFKDLQIQELDEIIISNKLSDLSLQDKGNGTHIKGSIVSSADTLLKIIQNLKVN